MLYIKFQNEIVKENRKLNIFFDKIYKFRYKFAKLEEEKIENGEILFLPNLEKYTYEKLFKYLSVKGITKVCI